MYYDQPGGIFGLRGDNGSVFCVYDSMFWLEDIKRATSTTTTMRYQHDEYLLIILARDFGSRNEHKHVLNVSINTTT